MNLLNKLSYILILALVAVAPVVAPAATNDIDTVTLGWDPNTESNLGGYKLYYSQSTNLWSHLKPVAAPSTQTTVQLTGQGTWYFVLTATNTAGIESLPSNIVVYSTPASPLQPSRLRILSAISTRVSSITTTTNLILVP